MRKLLLVFAIPFLVQLNCKAGLFNSDFKNIKKNLDTIVILPINVDISAIHIDGRVIYDQDKSIEIKEHIREEAYRLLKKNHVMVYDSMAFNDHSLVENEIQELFDFLIVKESSIDGIEIPENILKCVNSLSGRYYVLINYKGTYGLYNANNYIVSPTSGGVVIPIITDKLIFDFLLFDKKENKLIYFDERARTGDPRNMNILDDILFKVLDEI